jgi:hypothetical protein
MKTLLLCGYRNRTEDEIALGVGLNEALDTLIDQRIMELRDMGFSVVSVIAGAHSDDQLRRCRTIQDTELVFDDSPAVNLLSNTRAGLKAAPLEACFVLPVEIPPPPVETWKFLLNEYAKIGFGTKHGVLQVVEPILGALWHHGFPLLITREGNKVLENTPELQSVVDTRLNFLQVPYTIDGDLAPSANPL